MTSWRTAWRLARRGLDWRFRGLRLLIVCLALGVAALAAIQTLTATIAQELSSRGQVLLGGDLEVATSGRSATPQERAALARLGAVSEGFRLQAMAHAPGNLDRAVPVELKAVDSLWPLYGALTLADGRTVRGPDAGSAWADPGAADRLGLKVGQKIQVGSAVLTIAGLIAKEPDKLGEGFNFGPTLIVSRAALDASGLVQPGSMVRAKYRVKLPAALDPKAAGEAVTRRFPDAGLRIRTREAASPGLDSFVERMGQFLLLVALAALAIAGIGIAQAVASYCEARRPGLATLKVLGATGSDIMRIVGIEVAVAALAGIVIGLVAGVAATPLIAQALSQVLPVAAGVVISPPALATAGLYGLLIAQTFAAPPLARARAVAPMALFRARVDHDPRGNRAGWPLAGVGLAAIVALAVLTSPQMLPAAGFLAGAAALFGLLALFGLGVARLARALPRPARTVPRMALANLHRPGAQTAALVLAIGFGLSAFVLIAAVRGSLDGNIAKRVPQQAPDYFVLDLPREGVGRFAALVKAAAPSAAIRTIPAMRGTIIAFGPAGRMTRVSEMKAIPDDAWPLKGDRGLTYAETLPEGNTITAGAWWPASYKGEPLVSVDEEFARAIDLKIGDHIAISLLGIEREAKIASFRRIDWDSMGFNYVLVFSPNALADAPHNMAATIQLSSKERTAEAKRAILSGMVGAFPSTSVVEVGPVLNEARVLLKQIGAAILGAASVAILAGLAVLAGAIAAAREARVYDTVILRVLGAARAQLVGMLLIEYGVLVLATSAIALVLGLGTAWLVVVQLFKFAWLPDMGTVLGVLAGGAALVLALAVGGSLGTIGARPARALREL